MSYGDGYEHGMMRCGCCGAFVPCHEESHEMPVSVAWPGAVMTVVAMDDNDGAWHNDFCMHSATASAEERERRQTEWLDRLLAAYDERDNPGESE